MKPCHDRVVECAASPKPCKFHKKCDWCGEFHFVIQDPRTPDPPGFYGSRQGVQPDWPLKYPLNMACAGRPKTDEVSRK